MYIYTYIYTYMYIYIYIDIYLNIYIYRVTKTRGAVGGGAHLNTLFVYFNMTSYT
jgi:hypothetical protein